MYKVDILDMEKRREGGKKRKRKKRRKKKKVSCHSHAAGDLREGGFRAGAPFARIHAQRVDRERDTHMHQRIQSHAPCHVRNFVRVSCPMPHALCFTSDTNSEHEI